MTNNSFRMEFFKRLSFFRPQNNKAAIEGPVNKAHDDQLDDSLIKDPRAQALNVTVGEGQLVHFARF